MNDVAYALQALSRITNYIETDHEEMVQPILNDLSVIADVLLKSEYQQDLEDALFECVRAIRLTREYVGEDTLPAYESWSWFEALSKVYELDKKYMTDRNTKEMGRDILMDLTKNNE